MATETPKVLVKFDRVYGKIVCYPVNAAALNITTLTGKKTLSPRDIDVVRLLGFEIVVDPQSLQLLSDFVNGKVAA